MDIQRYRALKLECRWNFCCVKSFGQTISNATALSVGLQRIRSFNWLHGSNRIFDGLWLGKRLVTLGLAQQIRGQRGCDKVESAVSGIESVAPVRQPTQFLGIGQVRFPLP